MKLFCDCQEYVVALDDIKVSLMNIRNQQIRLMELFPLLESLKQKKSEIVAPKQSGKQKMFGREQVREIRKRLRDGELIKHLADEYRCCRQVISNINRGAY